MQIYPRQGLITIFLNQRGGGNTASGRQIRNTFSDAVAAAYWPK
jgi:hypothetical protein